MSANPGSLEAQAAGCCCATLDNNHGRFPLWTEDDGTEVWCVTEGCPLHWSTALAGDS